MTELSPAAIGDMDRAAKLISYCTAIGGGVEFLINPWLGAHAIIVRGGGGCTALLLREEWR